MSSPTERYSPVTTTKRVVEKRSNYKMYSSYSGSQDNLDQASPLSSLESDRARRLGSPSKIHDFIYITLAFTLTLLRYVYVIN